MPDIFVIGGPNGAGKTTVAMKLLPEGFHIRDFVNADSIAAGLSPFQPESVALEAGRIMLNRIRALTEAKQDFAFETTLAVRNFAPFLDQCRSDGYRIDLLSVWLPSVDLALRRVQGRVARGGHDVPQGVIRRRYDRGLSNFFEI